MSYNYLHDSAELTIAHAVEAAVRIPGWMEPQDLFWLGRTAWELPTVVEFGSWMGRSTLVLARSAKRVISVDHFKGSEHDGTKHLTQGDPQTLQKLLMQTLENHDVRNVTQYMMTTEEFSQLLPTANELRGQVDMIFIDAGHSYKECRRDIELALNLVSPSGIIAGHDYVDFPGVRQAVNEMFPVFSMRQTRDIWFWKPKWGE